LLILYTRLILSATFGFISEDLYKPGKRAVVGLLHLRRENTGGKLVKFKVVGDAVTAFALSGAGFVGAGAFGFIVFNLAFHFQSSPLIKI